MYDTVTCSSGLTAVEFLSEAGTPCMSSTTTFVGANRLAVGEGH